MSTTPDLAAIRARHLRAAHTTHADALVHASLADIPVLLDALDGRDAKIANLRLDLEDFGDRMVRLSRHLALAFGLEGTPDDAAWVRLWVEVFEADRAI